MRNDIQGKNTKIKLVAFDCDGVLTDNTYIYFGGTGRSRRYNTSDGVACSLFKKAGIKTVLLTSGEERNIRDRAKDMGVDYSCLEVVSKFSKIVYICNELSIDLYNEVVYVGNDINDKEVLETVKYAFCPADAEPEILSIEDIIVLDKKGGEGILRDIYRILEDLDKI